MRTPKESTFLHGTIRENPARTSSTWSDHAAFDPVSELDRAARRTKVGTDEGYAVWREWGSGPALVMLHGGSGSWMHFLRQIEFFSTDYRVIVPDMPGFGDAGEGSYTTEPEAMARVLAAGINQLVGQEPLYLAGFSYGGIMGAYLARLIGPGIVGFVLIGAVGYEAPRQSVALSSWRHLSDSSARRAMHRNNLAAIMIAEPDRIDTTAILIQESNAERSRHDSRPVARRQPLSEALDASAVPLAAIWGERDQLAAPYFAERREWLAARDPEAPMMLIADAGHWVQYEAADTFNAALTDCLCSFSDRRGETETTLGGQHGR